MGETRLNEIAQLLKEKSDEVQSLYEKCGDEGPRRDDFQRVVTLNKEQDELLLERKEIEDGQRLRHLHEERRATLEEIRRTVPYAADGKAASQGDQHDNNPRESRADLILNDPAFKQWLSQVKSGGAMRQGRFGNSPSVAFKNLISMTNPATGQPFIRPQYDPDVALPTTPLGIRSVITIGQTSADVVSWVAQNLRTNNATVVAEAATAAGAVAKPESDLGFVAQQTPVKTIATWIAATRNAMDDIANLRGIIDQELSGMVEEELEDQIINGDGTGQNFLGIAHTPGLTTQAFDTDILTTTRKGRTKVRTEGRAVATAYVLNPVDWEALDLTMSSSGVYYFGGPQQLGTRTLWGLPVVESEFIAAGSAWVGDMRQAKLWDRQQAAIYMTDSHDDWFTKNLLAILCELRAAFAVKRPAAIVTMDLTAA
jgi:HK97 family phage major capsid protein